jgi:DamX protein
MVDDDTFTYHVKQQPAGQINKPAQTLITKERTQKLDLLIHLLSNLTQALVVCGPEGIGKTTLLKILQERNTESWRYCLIQGNAAISFEAIQEQLLKSQSAQPSSSAPGRPAGQYKQVVLVIDNAGALVPGLIAAIVQYAAASPVLKVVFALTHDELQVKRVSDRAIDDCHIIEIPSLSEKQCGDFLQHLSILPYANVSFNAIGDNMVAHIYRETHGVPGRIIDKISGLSAGAKPGGKLKRVLVLAVAAAIAIAVGVQWLLSSAIAPGSALSPGTMHSSKDDAKKATAIVEPKANSPEAAPPKPETQIMLPLPPAQHSENEAKDAVEPLGEVSVNRDDRQSVAATAKPDAASMAADKPAANDAPHPPAITPVSGQSPADPMLPRGEQDKPQQPALTKAANNVEQPAAQNLEVKGQSVPAATVGGGQKQSDSAQQKTAEQFLASQEKLKQAELKKTLNSAEPVTFSQAPQKSIKAAAIPEVQTTETTTPQQQTPDRIGSRPIATLLTSRDGGNVEDGREPSRPPASAAVAPSPASADHFTLQLMVLSKQSSADDILKKYPALGPDINIIRTLANGKEKFILEYGSYPDAASANKAKESLPFEFHRALVKKK